LELTVPRKVKVREMTRALSVIGLERIGLVKPGDDVGESIFGAAKNANLGFVDGDVIVVSQKIVSKAEGLEVDISTIRPSGRARALSRKTGKDARLVELILMDTRRVLRADGEALVVERKDGTVCVNAGVDKSNVKGRLGYARLPKNSDSSAKRIRAKLEALSGRKLAVIVADTYSRPFRVGQVEFAIGVSGLEPIVDYRGLEDIFGYQLRYKFVGLADEVAAAAELVMGQGTERIPVAIVRGLPRLHRAEQSGLSRKLTLGKRMDLFHKII
jgi:coenzyme F420-0:L-glutamate ligase/coenzyme F420-1:gamma-L-glutamate ligase